MEMKIKHYPIGDLISAEYNPRQLTKDQFSQLKDSVKRFGLVDPIIVNTHKDRKNIVVGGHQRIKVADALKIDKIPCVEVKLNLEKERELNIRLNKNTGEWDYDNLANFFDMDELRDWGFSDADLQLFDIEEVVKDGLTDDDEIPEVEEATCKVGDLWLLGEHRLLCGDATKKEDVEILMDGNKADMVFTDPPYGMDLDAEGFDKMPTAKGTKHHSYSNIIGDDKDFNPSFFLNYFDYCKEQFWWGGDYYAEYLPKDGSYIVWDKRAEGGMDKMFGSSFELCWSKSKHKREIARVLWAGYFGMGGEDTKQRVHPTQKPIDLVIWFFEKYKGNKVVDLFLGSGSTLIACEKTNRKCYGMEIDPHYCDVIIKRWEDYTGKTAKLIGGDGINHDHDNRNQMLRKSSPNIYKEGKSQGKWDALADA